MKGGLHAEKEPITRARRAFVGDQPTIWPGLPFHSSSECDLPKTNPNCPSVVKILIHFKERRYLLRKGLYDDDDYLMEVLISSLWFTMVDIRGWSQCELLVVRLHNHIAPVSSNSSFTGIATCPPQVVPMQAACCPQPQPHCPLSSHSSHVSHSSYSSNSSNLIGRWPVHTHSHHPSLLVALGFVLPSTSSSDVIALIATHRHHSGPCVLPLLPISNDYCAPPPPRSPAPSSQYQYGDHRENCLHQGMHMH